MFVWKCAMAVAVCLGSTFTQCRMCLKIDTVEMGKCSKKCQKLPEFSGGLM